MSWLTFVFTNSKQCEGAVNDRRAMMFDSSLQADGLPLTSCPLTSGYAQWLLSVVQQG